MFLHFQHSRGIRTWNLGEHEAQEIPMPTVVHVIGDPLSIAVVPDDYCGMYPFIYCFLCSLASMKRHCRDIRGCHGSSVTTDPIVQLDHIKADQVVLLNDSQVVHLDYMIIEIRAVGLSAYVAN
jgi:hypothetical protein